MYRKKDREAFFASRRLFLYSAMPSDGVRQQEIPMATTSAANPATETKVSFRPELPLFDDLAQFGNFLFRQFLVAEQRGKQRFS